MSIRESFVEHFSEEDAKAIEAAAESHANGINDQNRGDDRFRWAFLIAIGYECIGRFREYHGIQATTTEMQRWALEHGDLGSHVGDVDYLSAFVGTYNEWVAPRHDREGGEQ